MQIWVHLYVKNIQKQPCKPGEKQLEEMFQLQGVSSPHLFTNPILSFAWKWSPPLYDDPQAKSIVRTVWMTQQRSLCHHTDRLLQQSLDSCYLSPFMALSSCGCPSMWIPQLCKNNTSSFDECAHSFCLDIFLQDVLYLGFSVCPLLKRWTAMVVAGWSPV